MRLERIEAVGAERERLLDLWVAAWTDAMPEIDFAARRPWFSTRIDEHLRDGAVLITARAEPDADLLGYALVNPTTRYLDQLAVDPARQGHGVAQALLAECKRICVDGIGLHVNQNNGRAVRLYQRSGFVITGQGTNPRSGLPIFDMRWTAA